MAVKYGGPEVRRQAEAAAGTVRKRAEDTLAAVTAVTTPAATTPAAPPRAASGTNGSAPAAPTHAPESSKKPASRVTRNATKGTTATSASKPKAPKNETGPGESAVPTSPPPRQDALAIPDYDLLSATQVIDRLVGLARPDLLAVQAYETAHRARTTILGKIAQLSA